MAKERVTEEIYKLLLKGRNPSLGFEFARRIGLIQRLWPDMAAMDGVPQEYDWHKEGDVWKHSMQNVDVMVEIANRELADGKIPTPDMWQKMEDQLKMFGNEIKKQFLFDLYKKEILSVLGQQGLSDLYNETNRLTDEYKKAHLDRLEGIAYETASNRAKNIFEKQISHWDEVSEFVVKEEMSDEERKRRIDDITKTVLGEILTKEKPKWIVEANALGKGFEIKEIRRILDEKIQGLVSEGKISQERLFHIEAIAEGMTHKRTEEERLKRATGLKNDIKIVLLMTALCHDLGKVTTTKFEDGRIRSKGHEQAGVEPMRRILSTFDTTRFSPQMRSMILPLIAEHLKPGEIYRDIMGIKNEEDEREEEQGAEDIDSKQLKRRLNRLSYRLVNGDADKSLKGGRKQVIYGDGGGANLYLLGLVAEADQRGRDPSGKPTRREDMGKKLDWQAWWNKNIEELNLNQSEEKIFSGDDLLKELGMSNKQGGPWVGVVMSCVNKDILDELIKKDKVDALQAAADYYQRLNIWVNGQYDLLPQEKKNERERILIWTSLLKRNPREVISL